MNTRILPVVRLMLVSEQAELEPKEQAWSVRNPVTILGTPEDGDFPLRVASVAIFAQLVEGQGSFAVAVECHQVYLDQPRRFVRRSSVQHLNLSRAFPLLPVEVGFTFTMIPFREEGVYEFSLTVVDDDAETTVELSGPKAELRIITV